MKKILYLSLVACVSMIWGCAYRFEQEENPVYKPPTIQSQPRLLYPSNAQSRAFSGKTKVSLSITKDGKVRQVDVIKSSGYMALDKAAVEFAEGIVFTPATVNDKPISARLQYDVVFNIAEQNTFADTFIREMQELLDRAAQSQGADKHTIQGEILNKDEYFIQNMRDGLNFNTILEKIVSPQLTEEWKKDWNTFPLSFLLYHDFITRFPDYDSLTKVKEQLRTSVLLDLHYIKELPIESEETRAMREQLLLKITTFMKHQYPDLLLEVLRDHEKTIS